MEELQCNRRVAYTDLEIALLIKEKMEYQGITKYTLFNEYKNKFEDLDIDTIEYMLMGTVSYDMEMMEIASDFLEIDFDQLTEVIEDDVNTSYRSNSNDEVNDLYEIVNILFSEMINQKRLTTLNELSRRN